MPCFEYGDAEITALIERDPILGAFITRRGFIRRETTPDLFTALVRSIVGQQISNKALETVWGRFGAAFPALTPRAIRAASADELQSLGISFRKARYLKNAAEKIGSGELDLHELSGLPDADVIRVLCTLDGVGVWTAEMLLLFSLERPDVLSFHDYGIKKGLTALYRLDSIDKTKFERFRKRYSPYGSVASLYLWEAARGAD